jgi:hypothetical protein
MSDLTYYRCGHNPSKATRQRSDLGTTDTARQTAFLLTYLTSVVTKCGLRLGNIGKQTDRRQR